MRSNSSDLTLKRNYLQKYRFLIREYESVQSGTHPLYKRVGDFYKAHELDRRVFRKYYNRYLLSGNEQDLLPRKRGPKYKSRRPDVEVEKEVISLRKKGNSRYEIFHILKPRLGSRTPSPSGIYNIFKRYKLNKLKPKMKEAKRRIIKEKAGELGHADTHYLSKSLVLADNKRRFLVGVIDSCTRVAWAEVVDDIKALTVMFAMLKCMNILADQFEVRFEEMLTDNGPEFGKKASTTKMNHPFQRLLIEMGVKQRFIRPYKPQTNGKIERFWRTLNEDLIEETTFETEEEFKDELVQYLAYYNYKRPHQGINNMTPAEFRSSLPN